VLRSKKIEEYVRKKEIKKKDKMYNIYVKEMKDNGLGSFDIMKGKN
jgi:hypothetical protein